MRSMSWTPTWTRALAFACVMGLAGCDSPTRGFEAFYAAVVDGKPDTALERMTPQARADLDRLAQETGVKLEDALARITVHASLRSIDEVERTDTRAILEVKDALGQTERVHMVKVDGRWLVAGGPP